MAKQLPKQVQLTVDWMKRNTLVVLFCGLALVVPVGSYFAADAFSAGVREEATKLSQSYSAVKSALNSKTEISIAGAQIDPLDGPPTQEIVRQFGEIMGTYEQDAQKIYEAAKLRNAGGPSRSPVVADSSVFPNYQRTFSSASKIRAQFVDALNARYQELLKSVRAGGPPSARELDERIRTAKTRFIQNEARVDSAEKLSADQQKLLSKELTGTRIFECEKAAAGVSFYADLASLSVPKKTDPAIVGLFQAVKDCDTQDRYLFELQWQYWIASDVLRAFGAVNGANNSVVRSPLKRLVRLTVLPMESGQPKPAGGEAAPMGDGSTDPAAAPADGTAPAAAEAVAASSALGEPDINPTTDAGRDYSKRFSGRVSNPVYDVRLVEVVLVAETSKLSKVFDALAAQNFMTIVDAKVELADPFSALRLGYIYGSEPVSQVTLTLESVWLRDVTAGMMPTAVRSALGIASKQATGAAPAESASE